MRRLCGFLLILWLCVPLTANPADAILGLWWTKGKDGRVEIYKCGDQFCGKIVEIAEKVYPPGDEQGMAGMPKVDRENPKASLQSRPIIGLDIIEGFSFNGKIWKGGTIYDPDNGKTYRCKIKLAKDGTLEVRGFIGISLLGRTEVWTRD